MAALTDLSDVINRLTGGNSGTPEQLHFYISNRAGANAIVTVGGQMTSLWEANKNPLGKGAQPTTSAIPVNDTNGSFNQTDPGGGRQKWLLGVNAMSTVVGTLIIYDRLVHMGGLSGTTTTAQTTNLPTTALSRYSGTAAAGNQIFVEIYTLIGTTATTATINYTNEAGTTGRTSPAFAIGGTGLREVMRMIPVQLQDGDKGVRAIENFDLLASTGTAGNIGICIARPLAYISFHAIGCGTPRDFISGFPAIKEIVTDACLTAIWVATSTTPPQIMGCMSFIES